jgi:hypothetical protein
LLRLFKKTGRPRNLPQIQLGLNTIANKKSKWSYSKSNQYA